MNVEMACIGAPEVLEQIGSNATRKSGIVTGILDCRVQSKVTKDDGLPWITVGP